MKMGRKGFTLIEIVIVLAVLAILAAMIVPNMFKTILQAREERTKSDLNVLKRAMIGDPELKSGGVRTNYGFLGDMGILPGQGANTGVDELAKLVARGTQPPYQFITSLRLGGGWQGPYFQSGASDADASAAVKLDAYGTPYSYEVQNPTGLSSGDYVARILSAGPDRVTPSADDIIVEVQKKEAFARVLGYVRTQADKPAANVPVTLYSPDARLSPTADIGIILKQTMLSGSNGFYEFLDVPFGVRSVMVEPRICYSDGSAKSKGHGSDVEFYVTNYSALNVNIVGVIVEYNIVDSAGNPAAFYDEFKLGGTSLFKATGPSRQRRGSEETINVSPPIVVSGSGVLFQPLVIQVSESSTRVEDISIVKSLKAGGALKGEILRFRNQRAKGGKPVDVTGVQFTLTFLLADGTQSVVVFAPTSKEPGKVGVKFLGTTRLVLGYMGAGDISKAHVDKGIITKNEGNEITIAVDATYTKKLPPSINVDIGGMDKDSIDVSGSTFLDEGDVIGDGDYVVEEIDKL